MNDQQMHEARGMPNESPSSDSFNPDLYRRKTLSQFYLQQLERGEADAATQGRAADEIRSLRNELAAWSRNYKAVHKQLSDLLEEERERSAADD